jgi:hypothetical protein
MPRFRKPIEAQSRSCGRCYYPMDANRRNRSVYNRITGRIDPRSLFQSDRKDGRDVADGFGRRVNGHALRRTGPADFFFTAK